MKPTLKAPGTKRLKLKYNILLSSFAFNCNLRRYTTVGPGSCSMEPRRKHGASFYMPKILSVSLTLIADAARHVIGCHLTRVQDACLVSMTCQAMCTRPYTLNPKP